jgi:hypothetical protein
MSNAYDGMASQFANGKSFGENAFIASIVASTVFWELLAPVPAGGSGVLLSQAQKWKDKFPRKTVKADSFLGGSGELSAGLDSITNVPSRLRLITTDTGKMLQACSRMHESAQLGRRCLDELGRIDAGVTSDDWQGKDEKAFRERFEKYRNSLEGTCSLAETGAVMTAAIGTMRYIQLTIAFAMTTVLAAAAVAWWAVVWIPVVGQGMAATIRAMGTPFAQMLRTVIQTMDQIMVAFGVAHITLSVVLTLREATTDSVRLGSGAGMQDLLGAASTTVGDLLRKVTGG